MNDIARAIMGEITVDEAVDREALKYAVQRTIFCPKSGVVLDIRRAVLVTVTGPNGVKGADCMDGEAFDAIAENLRAACTERKFTLEITDGRVVNARKGRK